MTWALVRLFHSSTTLPCANYSPASLDHFLVLQYAEHISAPGPLHFTSSLPETLFPLVYPWLCLSFHSVLCLNVTSSEKPFLIIYVASSDIGPEFTLLYFFILLLSNDLYLDLFFCVFHYVDSRLQEARDLCVPLAIRKEPGT